jgi:Flp pilus assembly protein TadG
MQKKLSHMSRIVANFAAARSGTSAIEFAFIAPVLVAIVLTLPDVANIGAGVAEMQTAVRASVQYAMNGGTNMTTAQTQGVNAWDSKPGDGTLNASLACSCSGAAADCQTPCADNTAPAMYVTVTATGTLGGHVIQQSETVTEKVRVR